MSTTFLIASTVSSWKNVDFNIINSVNISCHHFESFTVATTTWLTLWNIHVTNDHRYVPLVVSTSRSFPHSRLITGFETRLTRRVPLVEQEPLNLTVSDCPFGIFKLFLWTTENRVRSIYCREMIFCYCKPLWEGLT